MTKNIDEMTGEELEEEFFTKVKGWVKVDGFLAINYLRETVVQKGFGGHHYNDGEKLVSFLPHIDTSLDAFEEWVWPELRKLGYFNIDSIFLYEKKEFMVCIRHVGGYRNQTQQAPTLALAQIKSAMKALSKESQYDQK